MSVTNFGLIVVNCSKVSNFVRQTKTKLIVTCQKAIYIECVSYVYCLYQLYIIHITRFAKLPISSGYSSKGSTLWISPPFTQKLGWIERGVDETLFRSIRYNPHHVLHHLLPPPKNTGYNLRPRSHNFTLHTPVTTQNYLNRMLFLHMYWGLLTLYYIYWHYVIFLLFPFFNLTFYRIHELQWLYRSSVFYILIKSFILFRCYIFHCMCLCVWHILNKETTTTTTTTTSTTTTVYKACRMIPLFFSTNVQTLKYLSTLHRPGLISRTPGGTVFFSCSSILF